MSPAQPLAAGVAAATFAPFALAHFFSALVRAVTATLAPTFGADLGLGAADRGLLAGVCLFGFLGWGIAVPRLYARRGCAALAAGCIVSHAGFVRRRDAAPAAAKPPLRA